MLPTESAGAAGCAVWMRARYLARVSPFVSRFDACSEAAASTSRKQSVVFTCALLLMWGRGSAPSRRGQAPPLHLLTRRSLLRHSFEQGGTGNSRPENLPIFVPHANDFALAATLQTSHTRADSQTGRKKNRCRPVAGAHRGFRECFHWSLGRRARRRFQPARSGPGARVTTMDMNIGQELQTLTGLAAFQAKLGAFGTLVPASR